MANIMRFNKPFDDLFEDFRKGFWVRPFEFPKGTEVDIKIDVKEDDKAFTVRAEVPGVKKEDIQVDIDGDRVTVRAQTRQEKEEKKDEKVIYSERSYGMASRTFTLPADVDSGASKAEYKDGILSLTLPKKTNSAAKRITVS